MDTATHTPTPWAEQEMPGGCNDRITDTDGEGKTICEFPYGLDANSSHIVRCVNAHDDLVSALTELEREISAKHAHELHDNHPDFVQLSRRIADARAALAKAGAA